jgi:putative PIN family toxin of toxin-antitoxin system
LTVFVSPAILAEIEDVAQRPHLVERFKLTDRKLEQFLVMIRSFVQMIDDVPHVFTYDRDPKDEHYIDLAIATNSELVVSRDRDLLALADPQDPAGRDFMARYPAIHILTPVEMVARLDQS